MPARTSSQKNDINSMLSLGLMYEFGLNGIPEDTDFAQKLYNQCMELDPDNQEVNQEVCNRLTVIKANRKEDQKDIEEDQKAEQELDQKVEQNDLNPENEKKWNALVFRIKHNNLYKCDLNNCLIGDEGAKKISELLMINTSLTNLSLGWNNIGDKGVKYLCDSLRINSTLTYLYLGHNIIGNDGAINICETLMTNTTKWTDNSL